MKRPYIKRQYRQSRLMDFTVRVIRYFALGLVGCTVAYGMAFAINLPLVAAAIMVGLDLVLVRSLILLGCLWAIAILHESIR